MENREVQSGHEEKLLHAGQSGGGTGCPERLWSFHPWGLSGPYRINPSAAWSELKADPTWVGGGTSDILSHFQTE